MNNSRYYQIKDVYKYLKNPIKYIGIRPITTRSSWEFNFIMDFCDKHPSVLQWSSESIIIKYFYPVDGKYHRYFTDFYMKVLQENNSIKEFIVEIKPLSQTIPPKVPQRKTKSYVNAVNEYIKNTAKWSAARQYCESLKQKGRDIEFQVLTEKDGIDKKLF